MWATICLYLSKRTVNYHFFHYLLIGLLDQYAVFQHHVRRVEFRVCSGLPKKAFFLRFFFLFLVFVFFLRGSAIPLPVDCCYRQEAILLRLLGITVIISPTVSLHRTPEPTMIIHMWADSTNRIATLLQCCFSFAAIRSMAQQSPGVDVLITIFGDFCQFSAKNCQKPMVWSNFGII
jgi:hypothetical protein